MIVKWGTILGAFDIKYMSHTSVKGQVLVDLVAGLVSLQEPLSWKVYVDGVTNHRGFGVGLVLISPEKIVIEKSLRLDFSVTNNEAKYEALLVGITMV